MNKPNREFQKFIKATGGGSSSARAIGVNPVDISLVWNGKRRVPLSMAKKIIDQYPMLNINLYKLLYE